MPHCAMHKLIQKKARANMKLNKVLCIGLLSGAALALPSLSQAAISKGVENSPHDFSTNSTYSSWNTRHGVCSPCHAAHNTDSAQIIPLWSHQTSTGPFTMYSSPTLQASMPSAPAGVSLACLSCHDGTLGINAAIGGTNDITTAI